MAVPPAPVRVPSQRPLAPSVVSVTSVANNKRDNDHDPGGSAQISWHYKLRFAIQIATATTLTVCGSVRRVQCQEVDILNMYGLKCMCGIEHNTNCMSLAQNNASIWDILYIANEHIRIGSNS